jgi:hypothetical protein
MGLNIQLPEDLDRHCPDCGVFMDVQVVVNVQKGEDEITKILLSCPVEDCAVLSMTRKWQTE